jgi:hypothetical protein
LHRIDTTSIPRWIFTRLSSWLVLSLVQSFTVVTEHVNIPIRDVALNM